MLYSRVRDEESEVKPTSLVSGRATNRGRNVALMTAVQVPGTAFSPVILETVWEVGNIILMKK